MPAKTTAKGLIGESAIMSDLIRQGHQVAIPLGHNLPFDLIVIRKEDGRLEKVQCKYAVSDGRVIGARIESTSAWVRHKYTANEVDWIAVYEATTRDCFYLPSVLWDGMTRVNLRVAETANGQRKGIRYASDFIGLRGSPDEVPSRSAAEPALPFAPTPE